MTASQFIRQAHRWLGIVFTLTVIANFVAIGTVGEPPAWITYSPLFPLFAHQAMSRTGFVRCGRMVSVRR